MRFLFVLGLMLLGSGAAIAQDDTAPEPELQPLKGAFECSVLQTADGDVLHLNCTETESPLAEDWDYEIYKVERSPYSSSGRVTVWVRSNVDMNEMGLRFRFHYNETISPYVGESTGWDYDIKAGETWSESAYSDFTPWESVEILDDPQYGWTCKGCGEYVVDDVPTASTIDLLSINPADMGRLLEEVYSSQ